MLNFDRFTHLTFDCYGTLIDWETGILDAVRPIFARHGVAIDEAHWLRLYAVQEAEQEKPPFKPYREVLRGVMAGVAAELGLTLAEPELEALPASVGRWPPFPDTVAALEQLKARYRLAVISNIDDVLFAETAKQLQVPFDAVITAQQAGSYKPAPQNFHIALERLGVPPGQVLHVAQSLYHDHMPAKALGLATVWVNRPSRCPVTGISPPAEAAPDLEVPDLQSLVETIQRWEKRQLSSSGPP